jgi:hypothetical protein
MEKQGVWPGSKHGVEETGLMAGYVADTGK